MSRRTILIYLVAFSLLLIGSMYDLAIEQFLNQPNHLVALFFENYATIPFYLILPIWGAVHYTLSKQSRYILVMFCGFSLIFIDLYPLYTLPDYLVMVGSIGFCTFVLIVIIARFFELHQLRRGLHFLNFITAQLVITMVLINLVKVGWGRVRFREFTSLSDFTPWYLPNGMNGHKSFPSGHTGAMSTCLALVYLSKEFARYRYHERFLWFISLLLIVVMALSRITLGAHFLSDTVVSFLIAFTVFNCLKRIYY